MFILRSFTASLPVHRCWVLVEIMGSLVVVVAVGPRQTSGLPTRRGQTGLLLRFYAPSRRGLRRSFVAWVRTGARAPSRSSGLRGALQVKEPALLSTLGRKPSSHAKCVEPPQDELKTLIGNILSALSNSDGKLVQFEAIGSQGLALGRVSR